MSGVVNGSWVADALGRVRGSTAPSLRALRPPARAWYRRGLKEGRVESRGPRL